MNSDRARLAAEAVFKSLRLTRWLPRTRRFGLGATALLLVLLVALFGWPWLFGTWKLRVARNALAEARPETALEALRAVEHLQPDRAELFFLLAKAHRRAGDPEAGAAYLARAEQHGWPAEQVRQERALGQMQTGHFDESQSFLDQVLRRGVDDDLAAEIYEARAKGLLYSYRLKEALVCINFWLDWQPASLQPLLWRADLWERVHHWDKACEDYRAALKVTPEHRRARERLAKSLLMLNKVDEALAHYEILLRSDSGDPEALIGAAECRRSLSQPSLAEADLRRALKANLSPQRRSEVLVLLGRLALDDKRIADAVELLEAAAEKNPLNSLALHALGTAYMRLNRSEKGTELIERAREINRVNNRHIDITRELLTNPESPDLRWEAGKLLMEQGFKREGAAWMATALIYDPAHRSTHQDLAKYYAEIGDSRLAEHHRRMVEGNPGKSFPPQGTER